MVFLLSGVEFIFYFCCKYFIFYYVEDFLNEPRKTKIKEIKSKKKWNFIKKRQKKMIKLKRKSKNSFFLGKLKKNDPKMLKVTENDIIFCPWYY